MESPAGMNDERQGGEGKEMSSIKKYKRKDGSMLVCHVFRGKEVEAGKVQELNGTWYLLLKDFNKPKIYHNAGEYSSYEEASEKVIDNRALQVAHGQWLERQGEFGFLAMQYGDEDLEAFAANHIKPVVTDTLYFALKDMRDISQAGVIDNLLRDALRKAKFVVADLTHGNNGAYWEAGFAEALGKPVVYTCERKRFDEVRTHFDTNHCTTVFWSSDDPEKFREEFADTIRRSLGLV